MIFEWATKQSEQGPGTHVPITRRMLVAQNRSFWQTLEAGYIQEQTFYIEVRKQL